MDNRRLRSPILAGFAALFAVPASLVFSYGAADGLCTAEEQNLARCFQTTTGFVVEVVSGTADEFPVIDANGNSVFAYRITGPGVVGGSCAEVSGVSHGAVTLPVCLANPIVILGSSPEGELLTDGQGDPGCGYGHGDLDNDLFKWDITVECNESVEVSIVVEGIRTAEAVPFVVKQSTDCEVHEILGPGCDDTIERFCEGSGDCPCGNHTYVDHGGCANSTGNGSLVGASGSSSVAADDLVLTAMDLPPNQFALFIAAEGQNQVSFGDGFLCVGGPGYKIVRYIPVQSSGADGRIAIGPGLVALSYANKLGLPDIVGIDPGETWYWQAWYRDPLGPCGGSFNLSSALSVAFTP